MLLYELQNANRRSPTCMVKLERMLVCTLNESGTITRQITITRLFFLSEDGKLDKKIVEWRNTEDAVTSLFE